MQSNPTLRTSIKYKQVIVANNLLAPSLYILPKYPPLNGFNLVLWYPIFGPKFCRGSYGSYFFNM